LEVIPNSLDFTQVGIGLKGQERLRVKNAGGGTLTILSLRTSRLEFRAAQRDSLPIVLGAGESRTLEVTFAPRNENFVDGVLSVVSDAGRNPEENILLRGRGVEQDTTFVPRLEVTPEEIVFQDLVPGQRDTSVLILSNERGLGVLFVDAITSVDPQVQVLTDSLTIDPGQRARIQVVIEASEIGSRADTLLIQSNDPEHPVWVVTWRYTPLVGKCDLTLLPQSIQFRSRFGRPPIVSLPIRNLGLGPLKVRLFSPDDQIVFRPDSLEVTPNGFTTVRVRFKGIEGGNRKGVFNLLTNDPEAPTKEIAWVAPATLAVGLITPGNGDRVSLDTEIAVTFSESLLRVDQFVALQAELFPPPESGDLLDNLQVSSDGLTVTFPVKLAADTAYRLIVSAARGESGAELGQVAVSGFTTGSVQVMFGSIAGQVSFDDGRTFIGQVFVFNEAGFVIAQQPVESGGGYSVSGLSAGNYQIYAEVFSEESGLISGGAVRGGLPNLITLAAGEEIVGIDISLESPPLPEGPVNLGAITLQLSRVDSTAWVDALSGVKIGEEILVRARATDVKDLGGYLIEIGYDPEQATFKRMEENGPNEENILFTAGGKALFITNPPANGKVELDGAILGQNLELFPDGKGLLGVFRFIALENLITAEFTVTRATFQRGVVEEVLTVSASAIVKIGADFNRDRVVGFPDFLIFAQAFGTSRGDPAFNAATDLDGNGNVDFSDFLTFAQDFGKTL